MVINIFYYAYAKRYFHGAQAVAFPRYESTWHMELYLFVPP